MTQSLNLLVPTICMIAALAMGPVAPEAGNTLYIVAGILGIAVMWPDAMGQVRRPVVWMPLLALLLIAIAYLASSGPAGLAGLLYFSPLLTIWPLVTLSRSAGPREYAPVLGLLALCGAAGAAIMAATEFQATGTARAGAIVANPIHFADVALLVGFTAMIGVLAARGLWRVIFLVGPLAAIVAVVLSGTRGAIVAVVVMLAAGALAAALTRLVPRRMIVAGTLALIVLAVGAIYMGGSQIAGIQRVLADITDTLANGVPSDASTGIRLQMYLGGFRAFMEAPLFGHGPVAFTAVADGLADIPFGSAPHLHNDLVDMAASGGVLGLAAYFLIVLAPLVEALRAPVSASKPWTIVLVATLVSGFFVMGLTNAMFGILTVTVTFAAICAITGFLTTPSPEGSGEGPPLVG